MDAAYDHIAEEIYAPDRATTPTPANQHTPRSPTLNSDIQESLRAFSNTPWGSKIGGLWGTVAKQSQTYYQDARREAEQRGGNAIKWGEGMLDKVVNNTEDPSLGTEKTASINVTAVDIDASGVTTPRPNTASKARTESEILAENDSLIARFKTEAAKRLKDIEKAEDAADEALLRFGTNVRNFLRDAVNVSAPDSSEATKQGGKRPNELLFESKDLSGKRVIHTTRFDAQLHAVHCNFDSFTKSTASESYEEFTDSFDVEKKTDDIAKDLDDYPELRWAMEQLVPEQVDYETFWARYYFMRMILESQEEKRREMLKGGVWSRWSSNEVSDISYRCHICDECRGRSDMGR